MIPTKTVSGAEGFVPHVGGAVFNTAIALGRLGRSAGMLTGLSRDLFGQQLEAALEASGVDTAHVVHADRPTTLAFVRLTDGHASYTFYDENSAGRMLRQDDLPALSDAVSALYFGGISLACAPGADTYADLAIREGTGRAVMMDPNIRPRFISDPEVYRARLDRMMGVADIVKVSDEDLEWLVPGSAALRDKAAKLGEKGPSLVIVTRGGDGALAVLPDGTEVSVPAPRVTVQDTVGAGDTFNAGVLARLSELGLLTKDALADVAPEAVRDALAHGAKVAAVTVSRAGANPPWASEL